MRHALIWLILLGITVLRQPALFTFPRLWAEEGSVYLAHALTHGPWAALTSAHLGYYSLLPTLATLLSPVAQAPVITILFALGWQLATLALILHSPSRVLPDLPTRAAFCAALILVSPPEIWLNTINAQHWAAVGVFVMLFSDIPQGRGRFGQLAYLAIACLTGVPALLFAVYLPIRAMLERDRHLITASLVTVLCLCVQAAAFIGTDTTGDVTRFPMDQLAFFAKHLLATMLWTGAELFRLVHILPRGIVFAALLALILAFALAHRRAPKVLLLTLAPTLTYAIIATLASDGMTGGPRYGFPATAFLLLVLFHFAGHLPRPAATVVLAAGMVLQVPWFLDMAYVHDPAWPTWSEQLAGRDPAQPWPMEAWPPTAEGRFAFTLPPG